MKDRNSFLLSAAFLVTLVAACSHITHKDETTPKVPDAPIQLEPIEVPAPRPNPPGQPAPSVDVKPSPEVIVDPLPPVIEVIPAPEAKVYKTPNLDLPSSPSQAMKDAERWFETYANSEEFITYFRANVKTLQCGNILDVEKAITKYRDCFDKGKTIKIRWGSYGPFSRAIGGWDGVQVNQNSKMSLTNVERAGHWTHELSHYCGFTHEYKGKLVNSIGDYPCITKAFPYQIGYKFEDFISAKNKQEKRLKNTEQK